MKNKILKLIATVGVLSVIFVGCSGDNVEDVAIDHVEAWADSNKEDVFETISDKRIRMINDRIDYCVKQTTNITPNSRKGRQIINAEMKKMQQIQKELEKKYDKKTIQSMPEDDRIKLFEEIVAEYYGGTFMEEYMKNTLSGKNTRLDYEKMIKKIISDYIENNLGSPEKIQKTCENEFFNIKDFDEVNVITTDMIEEDIARLKVEVIKTDESSEKGFINLEKIKGKWKVTSSYLMKRF